MGEPSGRDTLNAVGLGAAVLVRRDPQATIGVFTADHVIEPVAQFQQIVGEGFALVERHPEALVTFGIAPSGPATGYGYLELGEPFTAAVGEKGTVPDQPSVGACRNGPEGASHKWGLSPFSPRGVCGNSAKSPTWRRRAIRRGRPGEVPLEQRDVRVAGRHVVGVHSPLRAGQSCWAHSHRRGLGHAPSPGRPERSLPPLTKVSVDYAVMEPASRDPAAAVAAIPMPLRWLDVGSWPSFAQTCPHDEQGNALAAGRTLLVDTRGTLAASSDPSHLIAAIGCDDLIIVHTPEATLVCRRDCADSLKEVHQQIAARFGQELA